MPKLCLILHFSLQTEDVDENINFGNYKGIYANDEPGQKYNCPETGAHFEFNDVCKRLGRVQQWRIKLDEQYEAKYGIRNKEKEAQASQKAYYQQSSASQ